MGNVVKHGGINNRPRIQLSNDEDDWVWLSDDELENAPNDTGTYEGFEMCGKPSFDSEKLNKWCARECERSYKLDLDQEIILDDFNKRIYNIPSLHRESEEK